MTGAGVEKYLLIEIGDLDVPAFLSGLRVERDQIVVRSLEEQIVLPDPDAAVADMCRTPRLPEVVPDFAAVERVERPHIVGGRHIQSAAHLQNGAFDGAAGEFPRAHAADNRRRNAASRPRQHARHPRKREVLHARRVDVLEGAVPAAGVVAGEGRPRVAQRFRNRGRIQAARRGSGFRLPASAFRLLGDECNHREH